MTAIGFDIVAFDLDGTLVDAAPDIATALNRALEELDRKTIPENEVIGMVGHGARALIRKGLAATGGATEPLVDQALAAFMDHYARHICVRTRPYEGAEEAMDALIESGAALAICTNKPEALTRSLIDALGWSDRFKAIVGGDTLGARKPDPAPLHAAITAAGGGKAIFVGDSITDADTARAAGIPLVAVSFGYADRPAGELGADAVIDHFDALVPTIRSLAGRG
ncbi:phosphoglycolate phosphatase [Allosphingosinicella vermicomposti]|uniref:phosphoglycolate phosphatase n=1 Tax=Allosphingosinicella vermicomposti TaxID=614671 RepID=UPI000D0FB680|nr:phosphoglycolate phosphatase [Allosphingosinicella vermicomposti]